jgi:hypothetical protein
LYKAKVKELEGDLDADDDEDMTDIVSSLAEAQEKVGYLKERIKMKKGALGVDGRLNLTNLSTNKFLQLRMSARALKSRIRDRLRQRKFELSVLERAHRHCTSGMFYTLH